MYLIQLLLVFGIQHGTFSLWNQEEIACPLVCTCRVELFAETSIHRFIKSGDLDGFHPNEQYNNEALSDASGDTDEPSELVHSATCVLQTETEILSLLDQLPTTLESLILIQGTDAGSKTLRISDLKSRFDRLQMLELRSQTTITTQTRDLSCIFDEALPQLKYANFEYTKLINGGRNGINNIVDIIEKEVFEYAVPLNNGKSLTFIQRNVDIQQPILPFSKYQIEAAHAQINLVGFDNLRLLRITHAQLNAINYEMFVGLGSLQHLLLEDNDLRIIPEFAFHGTPNLKSLSLSGNDLLSIRIADLAGLMHLEYLDLARNNFTELSELSLPPFPQLKLVNFADNPIGIIYPNTFEVLNTTKSIIVGGRDMPLKLMGNAFVGLIELQKLTVLNLRMNTLERDVFIGMPSLVELQISSGYISHIAFDTFIDCAHLERLIVNGCHIYNVSVDAFLGLSQLRLLDLSANYLDSISAATFDGLDSIREIYLSNNRLRQLPSDLFVNIRASLKLVRLDGNPWYCSCAMTEWRPTITNRVKVPTDASRCNSAKQKLFKHVSKLNGEEDEDANENTGDECKPTGRQYRYKYVYVTEIAPKCAEPRRYVKLSVFHAMRKMHCQNYTPAAVIRRHKMRNKKQMVQKKRFNNDLSPMPDSTENKRVDFKKGLDSAQRTFTHNNIL